MKYINKVLYCIASGYLIASLLYSCAPTKAIPVVPTPTYPTILVWHDTIPAKQLTPEQRQKLMDKFYEYNYRKYFSPEFDRLNKVIEKQSVTIENQSLSIKRLTQEDSLRRSRNIKRQHDLVTENKKKDAKILALETGIADKQKLQISQNTDQINNTKEIINILLVGWATMLAIIFSLVIAVYLLWKRISKLYQLVSHV